MSNRLAHETSPYLLQHKDNPVEWYPWCEEALERAKAEDKPIFLSVGYAACHWCHVMEHESFENQHIASLLNDKFVCIKVDREERPDLDQIYMNAVQLMTGHGGWPMSVFLTPDLKPFFGGTYWPPEQSRGMPGFDQVIAFVDNEWKTKRDTSLERARELTKHLQEAGLRGSGELRLNLLQSAEAKLERVFDFTNGGFGSAPKFPHAMDLQLLLRIWHRWPRDAVLDMVKLTLDRMSRGGIYDHLGGGFARYSVDARWLVPHFEKMLYDNALLAGAYLDGFLATGNADYARVARETLDYVLRDMTDAEGGFHSTEDADSEGEEGKFYVWTPDEIVEVLGQRAGERFCYVYDVTEYGNFEGKSILNLPKTLRQCASLRGWDVEALRAELAESRAKLLAVRNQRVRPGKDDKILVSWNALMIDSLARAAGILDEPKYLEAATRAANFLLTTLRRDDGRLLHCWRAGQAKLDAYLDDYAYLTSALVTLYEASFDERWIDEAVRLADILLKHFHDPREGAFFFTADDHEQLIARNKDLQDASVPSGNAMAAVAMVRLGKLCARQDYLDAARGTLESAARFMDRLPTAMGQMLVALDLWLGPTPEIVILGDLRSDDTANALSDLRHRYIPNRVIACRSESGEQSRSQHLDPAFEGKALEDSQPAVYICQNFTCEAPVHGPQQAKSAWERLASTGE